MADENKIPFDYLGAKKEGYSDDEIHGFLKQKYNFDFDITSARKSGYSDKDISDYIVSYEPEKKNSSSVLEVSSSGLSKPSNGIDAGQNTKTPDFGLPSFKQLAQSNQSGSDNTKDINVRNTIVSNDAAINKDEHAATKAANIDKAVTNTAINSLKAKGIKPTAVQLNQEKQKYQKQLDSGDASYALSPDGTPGLRRVTGGLENLVNGWHDAIKSNEDADKFVTGTTKDRVDFVNKHPEKVDKSEYIGERPSGFGDVTNFIGGAAPSVGKMALGAAIGAGLVATAPVSAPAAVGLLPTVLPILMTSRESATNGAMNETVRRYGIIKKDNPHLSDTDAMSQAEHGMIAGGVGGVLTNAAMLSVGLKNPVSGEAKSLLGNTVKHILKSSAEMGGISGVGTGLVQEEANLEGVKTSQSDIAKSVVKSVKESAEQGLLLTSLIHGVPNVLKSVVKSILVKEGSPEAIKQTLQENEDNGKIPGGTTDKVMNDLNDYKQALDKTPNGLDDKSQASVAGLIQKRTNIEKEAATKDVSAQPVYKQQIDAINQQIENIQRTGKPLEYEIDETTGKPYIKPTFDDDAKAKVEDLAGKISKGKRIEDAADLQAEANFPEELQKQLTRISKEEKSGNKDKENPTTDLSDNIDKYLKKNNAQKETAKISNTKEEGVHTQTEVDKNVEGKKVIPEEGKSITVIQPEDNKPNNNAIEVGKTGNPPIEPPIENTETVNGNEGNTVGASHESLKKIADRLGLEQPERAEEMDAKTQLDRGKQLLENGADPEKVAKDFTEGGKDKVSADEISVARAHQENLHRIADQAKKDFGVNSTEYKDAVAKVDQWQKEILKPMGSVFHKIGISLQGETDLDTGSFTAVKKAVEGKTGKPVSKEQAAKIDELTGTVNALKSKVDELTKKLSDTLDKAVVEDDKPENIKGKAKRIADTIRKGKLSRPDTFSAATPASLVWDGALETAAKTIEGLGTVAQAISDGIEHIKNSDWYKGLSADKQKEANEAFKNFLNDKVKVEDLTSRFADKRDNKFEPKDAKDIWDYAKKNYVDKGKTINEIVRGTARDLGLSSKQVLSAIEQPKGAKVISDEIYRLQGRRNEVKDKVREYVQNANTPKIVKWMKAIPNFFFQKAIFGHGTVGMITHAGMNIFRPSIAKIYWPHFIKQFKNSFGSLSDKGNAEYEKSIQFLKDNPLFTTAKRAGLKVDPSEVNDDYAGLKKWLGKVGMLGDRGFNTIKQFRMAAFENDYNKLSEAEKADPETVKRIAQIWNHATGTSDFKANALTSAVLFAPKLVASHWNRLIVDPAKAVGTYLNWDNASLAEKAGAKLVAKKSGEILATYLAGLWVNIGLLYVTGSTQKINYSDPTKKDWLKFKGNPLPWTDDKDMIDLSGGIIPTLQFVGHLLYLPFESKQDLGKNEHKSRSDALLKVTSDYVFGKLSPFAETAKDVLTAHDFKGNTLPWSEDKPKNKYAHKLTWKEYIFTEQAPLPMAEAAKDIYQSMEDRGMDESQISDVLTAIVKGVISGGTGAKITKDFSKESGSPGGGGGASSQFNPPKFPSPPKPPSPPK